MNYITTYTNTYEIPSSDYYEMATKIINIDPYNYYHFSDDFISEYNDYTEMFMMSKCTHNIIANSSFSWWGAYLNQNPDKKVIAPAKWYKPGCKYSAKDIYTSNMIVI